MQREKSRPPKFPAIGVIGTKGFFLGILHSSHYWILQCIEKFHGGVQTKPQNIYNTGEKGFLIGVVKKSVHVLIGAGEKAASLQQPGNRENITAIETVSISNQDIPPMVILRGGKYLYGWYCNPTSPGDRRFF